MNEPSPLLVKFLGGIIDDGAETMSVLLRDSKGGEGSLHLTPEVAKVLAFDLLALAGQIELLQEGGVEPAGERDEKIRSTAVPIGSFRVDWDDAGGKAHLHFWTKKRAHFPLSLERKLIDQLLLRLSRNPE